VSEFQSTLWSIIRGADRGEEAALREFTLKYSGPIVAYIARRGLANDAEDLAQEVFLRLLQDRVLAKADPSQGRFRSLLLAVTRHVIGHHRDRESAQKRGGGSVRGLEDVDVSSQEPDEHFDREWVSHLVEVALARLAREHPDYHKALKGNALDGTSCAEIAKALGKTEGDIHNWIHRGKKKLVDYLRDQVQEYSLSRQDYDEELKYLSKFFP
jgi:RNA polymerase sigma-70 factor (ECF subfamily)